MRLSGSLPLGRKRQDELVGGEVCEEVLEATDLAGNVDSSTTPQPVKIDLAQPGIANVQLKPAPQK